MRRPHIEDQRRNETIRAVWACIAQYGISGTTIERVAESGGFSKGVVHYYFDSKRDLLLAAFEAFLRSYDGEIAERLAGLGREPGARAALDAVIDACLPPFSPDDLEAAPLPPLDSGRGLTSRYKARLFVQFFGIAIGDREFSEVFERSYESQGSAMAECFAAIAPGLDGPATLAAAACLAALIDGFSLHRVLGFIPEGLPDHAELAKRFVASFMPSIRSES